MLMPMNLEHCLLTKGDFSHSLECEILGLCWKVPFFDNALAFFIVVESMPCHPKNDLVR
jgi:hypothetical protein